METVGDTDIICFGFVFICFGLSDHVARFSYCGFSVLMMWQVLLFKFFLLLLFQVIDVGGKEFGFKWSRDTGDLCDVYEELRSGDNGDGLLVESGCAWRKLNVQRELDETFKNHVKKLTAEAELEHKSRKYVICLT